MKTFYLFLGFFGTLGSTYAIQNSSPESRREFIRQMARESWPWYLETHRNLTNWPGTIHWALPSLWILNLRKEFSQAKRWIAENPINQTGIPNSHDRASSLVLYGVGSLLSCFALTQDSWFRDQAVAIADWLEPVYGSGWNATISSAAYQLANQQLEYRYLSRLTGNPKYQERLKPIEKFLEQTNSSLTMELLSTSVKLFLQSNGRDYKSMEAFQKLLDRAEEKCWIRTSKSGTTYVWNAPGFMQDSDCQLGAVLGAAAAALEPKAQNRSIWNAIQKYRSMAESVTSVCARASNQTVSGLTPYWIWISANETDPDPAIHGTGRYQAESELMEAYFVLYRTTKQEKYREWAWQLVKAIYRHCRTAGGKYLPVLDVSKNPVEKWDAGWQPFQLLASTLKYAYLIFQNDTMLQLDRWVFSRVGNPFPVLG